MKRVLNSFKEGNFRDRVNVNLEDKAGEVAKALNKVGEKLDTTLGDVRKKVSTLIGYSCRLYEP